MVTEQIKKDVAYYHLPGLFEFYELYRVFLPLFREHREYFYPWCEIGSIYGAPEGCIWNGGRVGGGNFPPREVFNFMKEYGISARLHSAIHCLDRNICGIRNVTLYVLYWKKAEKKKMASSFIPSCYWNI